ncbi:hypothetical protein IAR55_001879 [Kwoniella newhampshirensis]|uniref:Uncharacterized protein n=1 Tax=Kwoniella newhampshirensis TaxID=1651941 RepID=A0AAW0Z3N9_9TREE
MSDSGTIRSRLSTASTIVDSDSSIHTVDDGGGSAPTTDLGNSAWNASGLTLADHASTSASPMSSVNLSRPVGTRPVPLTATASGPSSSIVTGQTSAVVLDHRRSFDPVTPIRREEFSIAIDNSIKRTKFVDDPADPLNNAYRQLFFDWHKGNADFESLWSANRAGGVESLGLGPIHGMRAQAIRKPADRWNNNADYIDDFTLLWQVQGADQIEHEWLRANATFYKNDNQSGSPPTFLVCFRGRP